MYRNILGKGGQKMKRVLSVVLLIAVFMPIFSTAFVVSAQENEDA